MGGKKTPKAPKIDYSAQGKLNQQAFQAQNPNVVGPFGSVTYTGTPGEGDYTQNINLSPEQQAVWDARMGTASDLAGQLRGSMGQAIDWGQFGPANYDERRQAAEDAAYGRATSRLDPRFEQEGQALEVKLRSQGLQPGDAAYDSAMGNFNRAKEDAYSNAQNMAVGQGRDEAQLMSGMRGQQIAEEMQKRGWNLNEINALMSGANMPTPARLGGFQSQDLSRQGQLDYQANLNQFNATQAQNQGMMNAGAMMAAAYLSDIRLKEDIQFAANIDGINFYTWEWNNRANEMGLFGKDFGVIAQEIMEFRPEAVVEDNTGYLRVNYGGLH